MRFSPRTAAGWTIAVFGAMAAVFGLIGVLSPETVLTAAGFDATPPNSARVFATASSVASLNMGVYYLVAAATEWRPFFRFTVPFRLLTFTVFSLLVLMEVAPTAFLGVALWEAAGAIATGIALAVDTRRGF
ncbi:hypothetical protein ACTI_05220 [Actinoplanes sp. OR16]|uniref:hypothetical protein n=1 Tax=Actinoplanes sp. OR16 TaxID=946334 RepID=UPI000F6CC66A|nr:hypothetical protein [Actinoplanes sp. OR16]BBH63837.1 hypothetical protein ACTI_05220 [Actinoplanes sp. OR16]